MAETVILAEQELTLTGSSGIYTLESSPALFVLVEGETYRVVLDGTEYELVCILDDYGMLNIAHYVMDENEEPTHGTFIIQYASAEVTGTEGGGTAVAVFDSSNTANHTLAIYQIVEDEEPEEPETQKAIVLRDRNGNRVEYPGIERVKLNTASGETVEFVSPSLIPESVETTIDPDFSGGNIEVTPEDGQAFSKVTVKQPENLIPGNIAEGVDIAGIIGTLVASGGNVKFDKQSINGAESKTVSHNLGVAPDIIFIYSTSNISVGKGKAVLIGISSAAKAAGCDIPANLAADCYGSKIRLTTYTAYIDSTDQNGNLINNATETSFFVRGLYNQASYRAILIGGLT